MINKGVLLVILVIFLFCFAFFVGVSCIFHYAVGLSFGDSMLATIGVNLVLLAIIMVVMAIDCAKLNKSIDK
jgi:hypothetical protein